MENNNTNFDRIEAYLLGQMSAADATAFEQALQLDEKLAQEVAMQRLEHRTMELCTARHCAPICSNGKPKRRKKTRRKAPVQAPKWCR